MADLSPNLLKEPKGLEFFLIKEKDRLENDLLWHARLSQLFSLDKNSHLSESMVLASRLSGYRLKVCARLIDFL